MIILKFKKIKIRFEINLAKYYLISVFELINSDHILSIGENTYRINIL